MSTADDDRYVVMRFSKADKLLDDIHDAQRACIETHGLTLEDDGMDSLDYAARDLGRVISENVWEDLLNPSGELPDADELSDIYEDAPDGGGDT